MQPKNCLTTRGLCESFRGGLSLRTRERVEPVLVYDAIGAEQAEA